MGLVQQEFDLAHEEDAFSIFDQDSLPEALKKGEGLLYVRGGKEKYQLLRNFRRIQSAGYFARRENFNVPVTQTSEAKVTTPPPIPPQSPTVGLSQAQADKVRVLEALLNRLEKMGQQPRPESEEKK